MITILLLIYSTVTTAAVYSYHETSEEIPYPYDGSFLSGFRNVTDKDFILGGLFPIYDCTGLGTGMDGVELLEAMLFAIDRINNDMSLLPNLTIGYDVRDTCNDSVIGLEAAANIIRLAEDTSLLGIVGPAATSITLTIASVFDLQVPLVGYASSYAALSNKHLYEYFLRTIPSDSLQSKAMLDLVSFFKWEYVSVIFNDDSYGNSGTNVFIDGAMQHNICLDEQIRIPSSEMSRINVNRTMHIEKAVKTLLNSKAYVVIVYTDEETVLALFQELDKVNSTRKFVWIASDRWANSHLVYDNFPKIANKIFGFQPQHTIIQVEEFADYFSQLTPSTNIRDPFFPEYYESYCNINGTNCPNGDITSNFGYSQGDLVPFTIDAVYAFAHSFQNFLDNNCDSPLRWNRVTQQCDGMKHQLTGKNLLPYLFNATFNGIQNRTVSFDENGDPSGVYKISNLQTNDNGQYTYVSIGFWNSVNKENALILNNTDGIEKVVSRCSDPCSDGMIRSITNPNCPSCFKCIPCVGPTYSTNKSANNCSLCSDNHWGNNPFSGSTHCIPVKVRHSDFSSIWSIVSICIGTIAMLILAITTVIFIIKWNTRVVISLDREHMVMLLIGIGAHCVLIFIVVAPPSTTVCVFQRVGVWLCFSFMFGALLVKTIIVRVAQIKFSARGSATFSYPKYQIMFTIAIVFGQLILVVIGLGVDPPVVKRDPDVVTTNFIQQAGDAPEIVETCQQPHTAILVLSLTYISFIIFACVIFGLMVRKFQGNHKEARYIYIMFTSCISMVVWVIFEPIYFSAEMEFQTGILAIGIALSAIVFMSGIFFQLVLQCNHEATQEATQTEFTQRMEYSKP